MFKNSIIGRGITSYWESTVITNTITVHEKPRMVLYGGLTVIGNQSTPLYATGVKFGIMGKNGKYYGGSYLLTKAGGTMIQADALFPIRLRKKGR